MITNVIDYLEQSAELYPHKVAFSDEKEEYTFCEVMDLAKKIGTQISMQLSGMRNRPVAVYLPKNAFTLITFLGIVYSGNFYVPLDVNSPKERVGKILDVLQPDCIISEQLLQDKLHEITTDYIIVSINRKTEVSEEIIKKNKLLHLDTDPLYVLFTSGSTGVPKGVVIAHKSVIDYVEWLADTFQFDRNTVFGNQAPFYFDNSVLDIYSTLKCGSKIYIIPEKLFIFPKKLMLELQKKNVNTIFWVPSALIGVANARVLEYKKYDFLDRILFCGEVMPNKQLNVWRRCFEKAVFANLYGPTEITDVCCYYIVDREFNDDDSLPIGKPCRNMDVLVLNSEDKLCVNHEIGELCIKGTGLAMGYYKNPEKTKEAFVQNPCNPYWSELIYRTGDLVRYNEFEELEFMGRKDYQIKHNGYRIELGEIENAANAIEMVDCSCALYDEEKKRIILFCTVNSEKDEKMIYKKLKVKLPSYMLPGKIVLISKFPLNANGKINRLVLKEKIQED